MEKRYIDQIEHVASVAIQYFLNCDLASFKSGLIIFIVLAYTFRHFLVIVTQAFYDSALTVKADALEIKDMLLEYRERWENSEAHEALIANLSSIRTDIATWRPNRP